MWLVALPQWNNLYHWPSYFKSTFTRFHFGYQFNFCNSIVVVSCYGSPSLPHDSRIVNSSFQLLIQYGRAIMAVGRGYSSRVSSYVCKTRLAYSSRCTFMNSRRKISVQPLPFTLKGSSGETFNCILLIK